MLIKLANGRVFDPTNKKDGAKEDVYIQDGKIVAKPNHDRIDHTYDISNKVVMAGGIDIHTHIAGGKVLAARDLLLHDHVECPYHNKHHEHAFNRSGSGSILPTSFSTGYKYAEMGYTSCFEPAMLFSNARGAHAEMSDIPIVDRGAYVMLGNDDCLLSMIAKKTDPQRIRDYIAWVMDASQAIGIKVVNPGGINAFKFNQRSLDLDEPNQHYGITPRKILHTLIDSLEALGVPHPLHVHGCNLGVPGNDNTTLKTISAVDGLPMHLTHLQFHSYGTEGAHRFSSSAAMIAEKINQSSSLSVDVGQIIFGQTVTTSGDIAAQFKSSKFAHPKRWTAMDIECDAGCGVVPFKYRDKNFVNALQWCIGLELFLLVKDPWKIFLTTDHPNGAPFTSYPHLIRLLMNKQFRQEMSEQIHPEALKQSMLPTINREYSLYEIAILTRAAPAKSLGLPNKGHLGDGAIGDVVVYTQQEEDWEAMFARPDFVFKGGEMVVKNGKLISSRSGDLHTVKPSYDPKVSKFIQSFFEKHLAVSSNSLRISEGEITEQGNKLHIHPCKRERKQ